MEIHILCYPGDQNIFLHYMNHRFAVTLFH